MYVRTSKGSEQGFRAKGSTLDEMKSLDFENSRGMSEGSLVKGTFLLLQRTWFSSQHLQPTVTQMSGDWPPLSSKHQANMWCNTYKHLQTENKTNKSL